MLYLVLGIFVLILALIFSHLWREVSEEIKQEDEQNALLFRKKEFEAYKLPAKTEIKALDIAALQNLEKSLEQKSKDIQTLIDEIDTVWRQDKSTQKLQNKMHSIDDLALYVCDRREKLEDQAV